ncbi:MAG: hypothetical protein AAF950_09835 [Pseudomonadota bacterium]
MATELSHELRIDIPPDQQDAYVEAVRSGRVADLKAILLEAANENQRQMIEEILPPDLVDSDDF